MNTSAQMEALETRVRCLVDDRLIEAFRNAASHFGTTDLVLCFDESVEIDPVAAYVRETLVNATDIPESLREKLNKPARDAAFKLMAREVAFWFIPIFRDGEMACMAINATLIGPGGNA